MTTAIGDYALLSDMRTALLVSREGCIDWLCLPRIDSAAVFAALLGDEDNGRWRMRIRDGEVVERTYEPGTFILRTRWKSPTGEAEFTELMAPRPDNDRSDVVREVHCTSGTVEVEHELRLRAEYGDVLPWVRQIHQDDGSFLSAIAGPDRYILRGPRLEPAGKKHRGLFELAAGHSHCWVLTWAHSWDQPPQPLDHHAAMEATRRDWGAWSAHLVSEGPWADAVHRSLLTLRALTNSVTGGIVAAPTLGLPEEIGGERNWDYRYCWLRDSALTIEALLLHGRTHGPTKWRDWLLRAVAGDPRDLQIMYGVAGERSLPERVLEHLPGYADSKPVRVGNAAVKQYQADVVGEVMIALAKLREAGVEEDEFSWPLQRSMIGFVIEHFERKDQGLWEVRGEPRFFTHSRVMMWAALDRGVSAVEWYGMKGPVNRWREQRARLREEILTNGINPATGGFTQSYGSDEVDASLLQIPQTGFLPYDDPRMLATVAHIERDLMHHGFVHRYRAEVVDDGLAGGEHPFMACSFWLVEQYAYTGRIPEAEEMMNRLVGAANDLGLLAEEYDPVGQQQIGNYPQAFSHLGLVRAADALMAAKHAHQVTNRPRSLS